MINAKDYLANLSKERREVIESRGEYLLGWVDGKREGFWLGLIIGSLVTAVVFGAFFVWLTWPKGPLP